MKNDEGKPLLSRRQTIGLLGAAGLALAVGCNDDDGSGQSIATGEATATATNGATATGSSVASTTAPAVSCVITPELTEGPYFVDEMLNRSDIRSDPASGAVSEGVPLRLGLTASSVDGSACTPIAGAVVDVWHCDAFGEYSDVSGAGQSNTAGQKFLRGSQTTDENGRVEFLTIYPGWYGGRTVHIHFKVRTDPDSQQGGEFTSQFFFDEALTEQVYEQAPYSSQGSPDTPNSRDNIFAQSGGELTLDLAEDGEGYAGEFHVGVNFS